MSTSLRVETVLRVLAETASARQALAPALRLEGGALGRQIAEALDQGEDLPTAFGQLLPEGLRNLLSGPRPPLEEAALLAAEHIEQQRQLRGEWLESLLHPALTLLLMPVVITIILVQGHLGLSPWFLLPGIVLAGSAITLMARRTVETGRSGIDQEDRLRYHERMGWNYERAGLLARWRLSDSQLSKILGPDLESIAPLLAVPQAQEDARNLARFHRHAARRLRQRLSWIFAAILYVACGLLMLSAAVGPVHAVLDEFRSISSDP